MDNLKIIHVLDTNGRDVADFGNVYQTDGQWMLLRPLIFNGIIRYNPQHKLFLLAYQSLPIIYIYNDHFKLKNTCKIADFVMPRLKFVRKTESLWNPVGTFSELSDIKMITKNEVLIKISNEIGVQYDQKKHEILRGFSYDYYVLDLNNDQSYFVGELKTKRTSSYQDIFVAGKYIIRVINGYLYVVK